MDMASMVREMADNQIIIISDADREFVLGVALMMEMQEPVPASYLPRVQKIYGEFEKLQYL